jgi:AcrR family transcriptional regulator
MKLNEEIWIVSGYETFALYGESGLKVEGLAKKVGISKSSFYHHFSDLEIFMDLLMETHLENAKTISKKENQATQINPELINILVDHKMDLLFNRQLRINQQKPIYLSVLQKSNEIIGKDFIRLWMSDLKLNLNQKQVESLFELALENFYLQINHDNLNFNWLEMYFENLKRIACNFDPLYGSV